MNVPGRGREILIAAVSTALLVAARPAERDFRTERGAMVRDQIAARGVRDAKVLEAMLRVPRHLFVPEEVGRELTPTIPCPSATVRPSPSPSSWPS